MVYAIAKSYQFRLVYRNQKLTVYRQLYRIYASTTTAL